jgi:hypothetical protein
MANTLSILFWLHKAKTNREGRSPLIIRLTYKKFRTEKATGFYVNVKDWNTHKQRVKGDRSAAQQINSWIDFASVKVRDLFRTSIQRNDIHLPTLLNQLFSKPVGVPTLLSTIEEHNLYMMERVGNDFTQSTYEKYVFTYNKFEAFIQHKHGKRGAYLREHQVFVKIGLRSRVFPIQ